MLKVHEVIDAIYSKRQQIIVKNKDSQYIPKLAVYMDYDFYAECKSEITGGVSQPAFDFYHDDKIAGYPVWRVPPRITDCKQSKHAPFIIVETGA